MIVATDLRFKQIPNSTFWDVYIKDDNHPFAYIIKQNTVFTIYCKSENYTSSMVFSKTAVIDTILFAANSRRSR